MIETLIRDKLLNTGFFVENSYFEAYLSIISHNDTTKYTERHHILPKSYFRLMHNKIDNTPENIVRLSFYNHILAHYYLSLCTTGALKQSSICAFIMLIDIGYALLTIEERQAIAEIKKFAELKLQAAEIKKERCRDLGRQKKTEKHRMALSAARNLHATTKGKKSIYNKTLDKVKFVYEDELNDYLQSGWQLGGKPLTQEAKLKIGQSNSKALLGKVHTGIKQAGKKYSGLCGNKIICIETGMIFDSIPLAKQWLKATKGIDGGQIKNCCAGVRDTTGGYHWEYYKDIK